MKDKQGETEKEKKTQTDLGGLVVSKLSSGIHFLKKLAKLRFESRLGWFYELIILTKKEMIKALWIPQICVLCISCGLNWSLLIHREIDMTRVDADMQYMEAALLGPTGNL